MQRIIQHLADKVIVDTLANSPAFQRFAKTTVDTFKGVAAQAGKTVGDVKGSSSDASNATNKETTKRNRKSEGFLSDFKNQFKKEMDSAWKEIEQKESSQPSKSSSSIKNNR
eukprot:gb/GECG01005157.1/.p1 GENE.gb/GECG01005157.1/~~gb/GECG01005157.1/.p1  ORF type:complete len:112 (+),score=21.75 gb/GECG01005157.1/:1-336(+)